MTPTELASILANNPEIEVAKEPGPRPAPAAAVAKLQELNRVAVTLTLPYPPSANRYWRMVRNHPVVSKDARAYKDGAGMVARHHGMAPFTGPVALTVHLYRPQRSGDLSNRIKILEDALNGISWQDDSQIVELHAYLHDDKANPRAEIEIRQVMI